jgi:hypothetical protein
MYSKFLTVFMFSLFYDCFGQTVPAGMMSGKSALNDLTIIRKSIEELHPGLNRFDQRAAFITECDSVYKLIEKQDSISSISFFRAVNPLLAKVKCGHLKFFPPMKDFPFYYHQEAVLPFIVRFDDQMRLLIVKASDETLLGKHIETIDGVKIEQIISHLRSNMFVDGNIQTSADAQIEQYFSAWYASFIQDKDSFELTLRDASQLSKSVTVTGIPVAGWKKLHEGVKGLSSESSLTFENDSTAYLRVASFNPAVSNKAFQKFLDTSFDQIASKAIRHLIIDVRGNEGGNDVLGKDLYAHIAKTDFSYYDRIEVAARHKKDLTYRNIAYIPRFAGLATLFMKRQKDGRIFFRKHQNLGVHHPKSNAYRGNVTFLMDGLSFSATSEFLAVAKNESRGTFVGTESGGTYSGDNSGTFIIFKLPASSFDLGIPVAAYYSAVKPARTPARGIMPDFEVLPSPADLLSGRDTVAEFALKKQPVPTL